MEPDSVSRDHVWLCRHHPLGALLLMLPIASRTGEVTPFIDTLFTATSAVCVTGLIVYDTATHWTLFGQTVIILLIQIGGLGVVTVALMIALIGKKRIGLRQRNLMQEAIAAPKVGGIVRLTGFIIKGTFLIELIGSGDHGSFLHIGPWTGTGTMDGGIPLHISLLQRRL